MSITIFSYVFIFLYGLLIGSFLNVCIYRIPRKEDIVFTRSHCTSCGYQLKWYDLVPLISYLILKGRCHECKDKISLIYPIIEVLNGILFVVIFYSNGFNLESMLYTLVTSALIVLSVIDLRTFEIPIEINTFILIIAVLHLIIERNHMKSYLIGFFAISIFLLFIYFVTRGRGIGGGDIKLMAVAGLLLGYQNIILSFMIGCILGSVIHLLRMKITKTERQLAFGPYLSAGIIISMIWGKNLIAWYINLVLG